MKVFLDLDTLFFMVGAGTSCIVPLVIALYLFSRFQIVDRRKGGKNGS